MSALDKLKIIGTMIPMFIAYFILIIMAIFIKLITGKEICFPDEE